MTGSANPAGPHPNEQQLLDRAAASYRRRGYTVSVAQRPDLPEPLLDTHPDLIATRGDDRVAVVIRTGRQRARALPDMQAVHSAGWRLEFFSAEESAHPVAPPDMVADQLREAAQLSSDNHQVAALLPEWRVAEQVLRILTARFAPEEAGTRILVPDHVCSLGLLSDGQRQLLNSLMATRNQVAQEIVPVQIPDAIMNDAARLLSRILQPGYVPPPVMADRAMTGGVGEPLDQIRRVFPEADPADQADAADYLRAAARR